MPPAVVFVHIGAFKTGTSYLQGRLAAARTDLAAAGMLCPGERGFKDQVRGLNHVLGRTDGTGRRARRKHWDGLVATIHGWDGPAAVLSFEFLSLARSRQVQRLVADLAPCDVHVILTARDLVRVVPAMWQEVLQGGQTWTWQQYCETVASPWGHTVPPGRGFWRAQELPRIVRTWSSAVPVDRIHVVTVPPEGAPPEGLWHRFAAVTGIDPAAGLDAADSETVAPAVNASLDPAAAELMRRVNRAVEGRMDPARYDRVLKFFVAKEVLAARAEPGRMALSAEQAAWARRRGAQLAAQLDALGVQVTGDLGDLVGAADPVRPPDPRPAEVLDAAVEVIAALAVRDATARRRPRAAPGGDPQRPRRPIGSARVSRLVRAAYERFRA